MTPEFRARLQAMYRDMPPDLREGFEINEAFRTREYQQELWNRLHGRGAVARPGHSRHEVGEAVDISENGPLAQQRYDWIYQNVGRYGLEGILGGRYGSDVGHIQLNREDERTRGVPAQGASQPAAKRIADDLLSLSGIRERVYGGATPPAAPTAATSSPERRQQLLHRRQMRSASGRPSRSITGKIPQAPASQKKSKCRIKAPRRNLRIFHVDGNSKDMLMPLALSDFEMNVVFAICRPIAVDLRDAFMQELAEALRALPAHDVGIVYRIARDLQRKYFIPPISTVEIEPQRNAVRKVAAAPR